MRQGHLDQWRPDAFAKSDSDAAVSRTPYADKLKADAKTRRKRLEAAGKAQTSRTYGEVRYQRANGAEAGWWIEEVEPHVALKLKQIFPRIEKASRPPYRLGNSPTIAADLHWFMIRYPLSISAKDKAQLEHDHLAFIDDRAEVTRILAHDWQPTHTPGFRDGKEPYVYQAQAAEMTRKLGRLLLLDDVGLGKTVSGIATIADNLYLPAVVVVQSHLTKQWKEEIEAFTHLTAHIVEQTTPYELPQAHIYIFRYSILSGWVNFFNQGVFQSAVLDEIHELRTGEAAEKGRAALHLVKAVDLKLGLTATPIFNYGTEIWTIVQYIAPGVLGTYPDFLREWCTIEGNKWVVEDPDALGTYLREQNVTLRRTEDDPIVDKSMPPPNIMTFDVPYDEEVVAEDEELARQLAITVTTGSFAESGQAARRLDALARRSTGLAKARYVAAGVKMLLDEGMPVVLGGWHRDVYDIWLKELAAHRPILYTGSETASQKDRAKKAFIKGDTNLLILSLRSGVGLDGLQKRGWTVVFGELDWSPQVHKQFYGRLRRPGQSRQVDVIYFITNGGSDPLIVETLGLKSSQARGITDPLASTEKQFTDTSRLKRLAEQYLRSA